MSSPFPKGCDLNPPIVLPSPHDGDGGHNEHESRRRGYRPHDDVLDGMGVGAGGGDGRHPLVVLLVDVLVERLVMEQPVPDVEEEVVAGHRQQQVGEERRRRRHVEQVGGRPPVVLGPVQVHDDERNREVDREALEQLEDKRH